VHQGSHTSEWHRRDVTLPEVAIFDAHFHVIDPRFPLVPNQGFLPAPFTVEHYKARTAHLGITGGAVVSGSFQAYDQTYLLDALEQLGDDFVGVASLPRDVTDREALALYAGGVRAYRVNLFRGGDLGQLDEAERFAELCGWHVEVYLDGDDLPELAPKLAKLPRVVIDHLGMANLDAVKRVVEHGAYVKATGFGRMRHDDVAAALRVLSDANPAAILFGTDLPSTRARRAFQDEDLQLVREIAGPRALYANAAEIYR
jgi:predicted TIM-barrel fold metal-dependent hydrolase